MASPTLAAQLEAVETAILNIMNGGAVQAYTIGNRNIQKMTLTELRNWRDQLKAETTNASGGAMNYATFENAQ